MIAPLKIGSLALSTNLLFAPMAGFCEMAFRRVVRSCGGVGLAYTPLLSPQGILHNSKATLRLTISCPQDHPLGFQIYGADEKLLCEAARWSADQGADLVDLNMGCPVPKITRRDGGARLLCFPDRAVRLAEAVVRAVPHLPVTAKLRLGWDDGSIVAPQLAADLERAGVAAITIHGRTAAMQFTGQVRLDGIAAVVAAVRSIPVIGNGDIHCPADAEAMIRQTGCQGVMIGRWALAAPWIFRDTWSHLTTGTIPPEPTFPEKIALIREHFRLLVEERGQRIAALEFRKRVGWYGRGIGGGCKMLRFRGQRIRDAAEFEELMTDFVAARQGIDKE